MSHSSTDKLVFLSDPHLGLRRQANTTKLSEELWRTTIYAQLLDILDSVGGTKICGGDLFDRYSNDESTISQGMTALQALNLCLAGNHDVSNRTSSMGSLQLLRRVDEGKLIVAPTLHEPYAVNHRFPGVCLTCVPHAASQELFEASLDKAETLADEEAGTRVLLLHCNFALNEEWLSNTSLNLTYERAKRLLDTFDYVLLGHEHQPADHFDGRLRIIGTTFPTSKTDTQNDKRILILEDGELTEQVVWERDKHCLTGDVDDLPFAVPPDCQFLTVTGTIKKGALTAVAARLREIWANSQGLLAVFLEAQPEESEVKAVKGSPLQSVVAAVDASVKGKKIEPLWKEGLEAVK